MAFNKASFITAVKAAFDDAVGSETANADTANAFGDALETAFSELEVAAGDVTVPGLGLVAPTGPITGSATLALIAPGKIK